MSTEAGSVSLAVHEEFEQRMNDNIHAQNVQIADIKSRLNDTHEMVSTISRLAASMEAMSKEQSRQGDDIREIRSTVESINVEHIEIKLNEHDHKLEDHDKRIREQELKPQDSTDHEERLRALEGKGGKYWEKIVLGVIAGVVGFLVTMACTNLFH